MPRRFIQPKLEQVLERGEPLPSRVIATRIGCSRSSVGNALWRMRLRGVVAYDREIKAWSLVKGSDR